MTVANVTYALNVRFVVASRYKAHRMNQHADRGERDVGVVRAIAPSRRRLAGVIGAAIVVLAILLSSLGVFSPTHVVKGTVVSSLSTSRYGTVLVVGGKHNVALSGFPLYEFSGDVDGHLGCGTTKAKGYDTGARVSVTLTCSGPQGDLLNDVSSDDWPALTTKASPIAGAGVEQRLLGTIHRTGIGDQITYAGHPLYLFDPASQPFIPQGENFMETVSPLPPWHGYWYLVSSRTGADAPGAATIETETLADGRSALALDVDENVNPLAVSVYTGVGSHASLCTTSCSGNWTPVVTESPPNVAVGVDGSKVGVNRTSSGLLAVTYDGRPLYLYSKEMVLLGKDGHVNTHGTAGNGTGQPGPDGTMSVVYVGS